MDAFAAAVDDLFADPNLAVDILYRPGGVGDGVAVRAMRRAPDDEITLAETRLVTPTSMFEVRVSEVAAPADGDTITLGSAVFVIQGTPRRRDPLQLIWALDARPQGS